MKEEVLNSLEDISQGNISMNLYDVVRKNEKEFQKAGFTIEGFSNLLELKQNAEDYPDPIDFQIFDQGTADYILANRKESSIKLRNDKEHSFCQALLIRDSHEKDYEQKANEFAKLASKFLNDFYQTNTEKQIGTGMWNEMKNRIGQVVGNVKVLLSEKDAGTDDTVNDGKQWIMTNETKLASDGVTVLHRIHANQNLSFPWGTEVPKGTPGGWVESEENLEANVWVGDDAEVYGNARITNESSLWHHCVVKDHALVEDSHVWGNAMVTDFSVIKKRSSVCGDAHISGSSIIETSNVDHYSSVSGNSYLRDCVCEVNTQLVDCRINNAYMKGDFYGVSAEIDRGRDFDFCFYPMYSVPLLLHDSDVMDRLRASQKNDDNAKGRVQEVRLFGTDEREFIADLELVRIEEENRVSSMKVVLSHPIVRCNGVDYDGQKIVDGISEVHSTILNVAKGRLSEMMDGIHHEFISKKYIIGQEKGEFVVQDIAKRISDIQIYSHNDGGMAIRCKIDDIQQGAKLLSREDVVEFDDKRDRSNLAARYFADVFSEPERTHSLGR